jgi:hypothetical protein
MSEGPNTAWLAKDELFPAAMRELQPAEVLLDIGCGIMPQKYVRPLVHICCEPFAQYVQVLQEKVRPEADRRYVVLNATWADAVRIFPERSVDSVFLVDVIEHLEKKEALELVRATERLCRRQLVVFTPLGFMPQHHPDGKDAWGLDGGRWQEHKSGWQPEDFDASWRIFAARSYHEADNLGRRFDTPYGAMWAIKDMADVPYARPWAVRQVLAGQRGLGWMAALAARASRKLCGGSRPATLPPRGASLVNGEDKS